ncbi:hypothetical protein BgAZ_205040 [Babesia gibsoni]|uniref:Uncharacterized protein n=1 Tax=Babesia gibsoni TaxID=33632 RepID=A0AAD8PDP2_BABGI|nr:hypothetical protein BgAZ_205040 [Babesia gibsoni]
MEHDVSRGHKRISRMQSYMLARNPADIMRWWLKHKTKPHQEFNTFISAKPSDIVAQLIKVRREAETQQQIAILNSNSCKASDFRVQRLSKGQRVHTLKE